MAILFGAGLTCDVIEGIYYCPKFALTNVLKAVTNLNASDCIQDLSAI